MNVRLAWGMLMTTLATGQSPGPGISQELAGSRRAQIAGVGYQLQFDLVAGSDSVTGEGTVEFALAEGAPVTEPVMLDFAGETLSEIRVNGMPHDAQGWRVDNHVVVPIAALAPGRNQFTARFTAKAAATGTPLTVFRDTARNEEFWYTLLVPADAHRLFPCFDQPDLKATWSLRLATPESWVAVANGAERGPPQTSSDGRRLYEFVTTAPLSTYLFAFAAGPFAVHEGQATKNGKMRLFVRPSKRPETELDLLLDMHARALAWLGDWFAQPYPFGKLDIVLLPGFPYGGMEHAGAIFYRESALAFDHVPTESELVRRSTLIYHEVSHQWFGNLVTMEWFDDLWLKEGFATLMGYWLLEVLEPKRQAWLRFHQQVKPPAYRVDVTAGTTPIWQELDNLDNAKSAYGAIVYNKAPAVLRELTERLGVKAFRDGVRLFLANHAFGTARWRDLVRALEQTSGQRLQTWSERWILAAGMPRLRPVVELQDNIVKALRIEQQSVRGDRETWPLRIELWAAWPSGEQQLVALDLDRADEQVPELAGKPPPARMILNPRDVAYAQVLLDPASREAWLDAVADETDPLRRAVVLSALFESVREAELDPARWVELVHGLLPEERDPLTHAWLLGTTSTALSRWLADDRRVQWTERVVTRLLAQLEAGMPGLELQTFRFLAPIPDPRVTALCVRLLTKDDAIPGLRLGLEDRYRALAALLAAGQGGTFAAMIGPDVKGDAAKHAFVAQAAAPEAATKLRYFSTYLQPDQPPEQWMEESLGTFHWPGQETLTLPHLRAALDRVLWVKEHRRIFFMPAWVDAFINGHSSRQALEVVTRFLVDKPDLPIDVRRKVLQSLDGLERAVRIKQRWQ